MQIDWYLTILLVLMLVGAIVAVEARDLLSAVISVGVVGFAASIGFLILGAPDLAITQVVVEIIVLVVLIRAMVVRDETVMHRYRDTFAVAAGMIALGVMVVVCSAVYIGRGEARGLPPFGNPVALRPYAPPGAEIRKNREAGVSRLYLDESYRALDAREKGKPFDPKGEQVHVPNRVTAIILDYRGYDTLGEATVILTAIVGALVVLRRKGRVEGRT
ncbi:MAG: hydrogenase subunit MbhD domain-containing protein [Planctomycetota bacterium]